MEAMFHTVKAYDKLLLFKECPLFLSLFLVRPTGSPTQR